MEEKPEIGKKEKLKEEAAVSSAEIKLKDKLGDRVAFAPGYGCGNEPPKTNYRPEWTIPRSAETSRRSFRQSRPQLKKVRNKKTR